MLDCSNQGQSPATATIAAAATAASIGPSVRGGLLCQADSDCCTCQNTDTITSSLITALLGQHEATIIAFSITSRQVMLPCISPLNSLPLNH